MFGPCKVCLEKDKTLSVLRDEVVFLRKQIARPEFSSSYVLGQELEADGIISGTTDQIEIQTHKQVLTDEQRAELAERDAILSGEY